MTIIWGKIVLTLVPVSVLFEGVEYFLRVRVHQVGPRLPKRMHNVIDESDLRDVNELQIKIYTVEITSPR